MSSTDLAPTTAADLPPENVPDLVRQSCRLLWEGNDVEPGLRASLPGWPETPDQEGDREAAYQAGVDAAIQVWTRLIPGPSPTDGVHHDIVQLWTHQRFLLAHDIHNTALLTEIKEFVESKFAEYEHLLPKPGSLAARAGAWGATRRG